MNSVGIIGGLGPETTAEFYLRVNFACQKLNNISRPQMIIQNVPLPFEIERNLIENNSGKERYIPYLVSSAKMLEKAGANFIVMPCNSLHVFIDEIRDSVSVPMISIVEETCGYIKMHKYNKIGLISTSATVENKVYEKAFESENIDFMVPDELQCAEMNKIIQNLINGIHLNSDRIKIMQVIEDLKKAEVDSIALACTDLQLLLPNDDDVHVFDTMDILAQATVRELLK